MQAMTGDADDRTRHRTDLSSELASFLCPRSAPHLASAPTSTVTADMAPNSRERVRNRCRVSSDPGGTSLTSVPTSPARSSNS